MFLISKNFMIIRKKPKKVVFLILALIKPNATGKQKPTEYRLRMQAWPDHTQTSENKLIQIWWAWALALCTEREDGPSFIEKLYFLRLIESSTHLKFFIFINMSLTYNTLKSWRNYILLVSIFSFFKSLRPYMQLLWISRVLARLAMAKGGSGAIIF